MCKGSFFSAVEADGVSNHLDNLTTDQSVDQSAGMTTGDYRYCEKCHKPLAQCMCLFGGNKPDTNTRSPSAESMGQSAINCADCGYPRERCICSSQHHLACIPDITTYSTCNKCKIDPCQCDNFFSFSRGWPGYDHL